MKGTHIRAIDGLRAIAVLGVVAHHASLLPYGIGSRGVELFFVISGFCLSLPTLQRLAAGAPFVFDRKRFALGRLVRIVPPYYAALAVFIALSLTSFGTPSIVGSPNRLDWLSEALFLTASHHADGSAPAYNASFWTLGDEMRWYLVFPLLLAAYVRSKWVFAGIGIACYALAWLLGGVLDVGTLPCFMLGIVAADLFVNGRARSVWYPLLAAACFVPAAIWFRGDAPDYPLWHFTAFFLVLSGVGLGARAFGWAPLVATGAASYSIYLVHQPLLVWMYSRGVPLWACVALSVAAGFAFWFAIERPSVAAATAIKRGRLVTASAST